MFRDFLDPRRVFQNCILIKVEEITTEQGLCFVLQHFQCQFERAQQAGYIRRHLEYKT